MSKALNRFKKKMSATSTTPPPNNFNSERCSYVKRSDKISGLAKLLEKQIGGGKNNEKNDENEKPVKDEDNTNIIELIKKSRLMEEEKESLLL